MIDGVDSSVNRAGEIFHAKPGGSDRGGQSNRGSGRGLNVYVKLTNAKSAGQPDRPKHAGAGTGAHWNSGKIVCAGQ